MSNHIVIAGVSALLWASIWLIFFRRDLNRWWTNRPRRREFLAQQAERQAEARRRMLDEMAQKYGVPDTAKPVAGKPG